MKPQKLNSKIVNLITARLVDEFAAFYQYRATSNWCKGVGYEKAAEYFNKESDDELTHAKKLMDFLTDWNIVVSMPSISQPQIEFKSLVEAIELAYNLEIQLYNDYNDICETIEELDSAVYQFLTFFLEIQTRSVAEYSDKLNLLDGVKDDKFSMLLLEDKLFG